MHVVHIYTLKLEGEKEYSMILLVRVTAARMKHHGLKQVGEERVFPT